MVTTLSLTLTPQCALGKLPFLITTALGNLLDYLRGPGGKTTEAATLVYKWTQQSLVGHDRPPPPKKEKMTYGISSPLYSSQFVQGDHYCNALVSVEEEAVCDLM